MNVSLLFMIDMLKNCDKFNRIDEEKLHLIKLMIVKQNQYKLIKINLKKTAW